MFIQLQLVKKSDILKLNASPDHNVFLGETFFSLIFENPIKFKSFNNIIHISYFILTLHIKSDGSLHSATTRYIGDTIFQPSKVDVSI